MKESLRKGQKWPFFGPKRGFRALPRDPGQTLEKGPGPGSPGGRPGSLPRTPGPGPGPRARAGAARAEAGSGDPGWDGGPPWVQGVSL